jgi:hypothetical protein
MVRRRRDSDRVAPRGPDYRLGELGARRIAFAMRKLTPARRKRSRDRPTDLQLVQGGSATHVVWRRSLACGSGRVTAAAWLSRRVSGDWDSRRRGHNIQPGANIV